MYGSCSSVVLFYLVCVQSVNFFFFFLTFVIKKESFSDVSFASILNIVRFIGKTHYYAFSVVSDTVLMSINVDTSIVRGCAQQSQLYILSGWKWEVLFKTSSLRIQKRVNACTCLFIIFVGKLLEIRFLFFQRMLSYV